MHIISHPGNPRYPIDIPRRGGGGQIRGGAELNNSSFTHSRKGSEANCRTIAAAVRDAGGWLALGSDSHVAFSLGNFEHCERIIEEVGFPQERILNVSPRRLLDFLERRGKPAIAELADL